VISVELHCFALAENLGQPP